MVTEAHNKIIQTVKQAGKHIGHLIALIGSDLHLSEENKDDETISKVKTKCCWIQNISRLISQLFMDRDYFIGSKLNVCSSQ